MKPERRGVVGGLNSLPARVWSCGGGIGSLKSGFEGDCVAMAAERPKRGCSHSTVTESLRLLGTRSGEVAGGGEFQ